MPQTPPRIVVVGSINVDLVVTTDRFPSPGETRLGSGFRQTGGGKGANQAVAAARLGAQVTLIARVGDDAFGKSAVANLKAEGIDCRFVRESGSTPTGTAAITVQQSTGENQIIVVPGANALLDAADIESAAQAIAGADIVVLSLEVPLTGVAAAARIAADSGVPVVLNPAPAQPLSAELLACVTVLLPNETEARILSGAMEVTAAAEILSNRVAANGLAVVTLGRDGILAVPNGGDAFKMAAFQVDALDTVGAGDCFTAALAVELAAHKEQKAALQFALAAAALAVTKLGAQDAMPRRAEVEAFLESVQNR